MATVNAIVLPVDRAASSDPQVVAGVPGRWYPGVAYLPEAMGMTEDEAREAIAALGPKSPLVWTEVDAEEGEANPAFVAYPSQVPSGYVDVDAQRRADAESGGTAVGSLPSWAASHRERSTDLVEGRDPDAAALERAAQAEREGMKMPQLRERAQELGVDHTGLKKDDLLKAIAEAEEARIEAPDAMPEPTVEV